MQSDGRIIIAVIIIINIIIHEALGGIAIGDLPNRTFTCRNDQQGRA